MDCSPPRFSVSQLSASNRSGLCISNSAPRPGFKGQQTSAEDPKYRNLSRGKRSRPETPRGRSEDHRRRPPPSTRKPQPRPAPPQWARAVPWRAGSDFRGTTGTLGRESLGFVGDRAMRSSGIAAPDRGFGAAPSKLKPLNAAVALALSPFISPVAASPENSFGPGSLGPVPVKIALRQAPAPTFCLRSV